MAGSSIMLSGVITIALASSALAGLVPTLKSLNPNPLSCQHWRIIQAYETCLPLTLCVPCVPEDIDNVCKNIKHYAVLVGSADGPRWLVERKCDPSLPSGQPDCPTDSVCVPDGSGRGTCCVANSTRMDAPSCGRGKCPALRVNLYLKCPYFLEHECIDDAGCPKPLKCCGDECGQRKCRRPLMI